MERTDSAWVAGRKATRHHNQIKSSRRLSRRRICTILEPDYAAARRKFAKRDQNSVYNIMRRQIFLFLTQLRDIVAWKANRKFPRPPKTTNFRERLPLYIKKIPFPDQEIASGRPKMEKIDQIVPQLRQNWLTSTNFREKSLDSSKNPDSDRGHHSKSKANWQSIVKTKKDSRLLPNKTNRPSVDKKKFNKNKITTIDKINFTTCHSITRRNLSQEQAKLRHSSPGNQLSAWIVQEYTDGESL